MLSPWKQSIGIALFAVAAVAAPAEAQANPQPLPTLKVEQYKLANGLQVLLHEDHTTPTVVVNLWYHVGSKDEPAGRNGFAHLFEHLMFQGSKHVGEDQFFMYLERAGASDRNGTTSLDRTNYYETLPSNQLELALWLESDRMGFLLDHVDQKTFESQRNVVLNERRQNYVDAPYGMVSKFIRERLFPAGHPYHNLTIGSPEDLGAATLQDVQAFYKTYYVPNNASLAIAGDIDPVAARALVEKFFGPIPAAAQPVVATTPMPVQLDKETVIDVEAAVELPRVYVSYPTPPLYAPGDAELDGVSQVLSDGKTSRLYKRLVYDLQIAKEVWAYQASSQLASNFEIGATVKSGSTPAEVLKVIDEEIARLAGTAPTAEETNRAKANMESSLIFRIEGIGERGDLFNTYAQLAGSPDYFPRDVARYRSLTPAALQHAVQQFLPAGKRIVVIVTPNPSAPRAGVVKGTR